jgi:hypothetical protein
MGLCAALRPPACRVHLFRLNRTMRNAAVAHRAAVLAPLAPPRPPVLSARAQVTRSVAAA